MNIKKIFLSLILMAFNFYIFPSQSDEIWNTSLNMRQIVPIQLDSNQISLGIKQMNFLLENSTDLDGILRTYTIVGTYMNPVVNKDLAAFVNKITPVQWAEGYYFKIVYVQRSTGKVFLASEVQSTYKNLSQLPIDIYLSIADSSGIQVAYGKISDDSIKAANSFGKSAALMKTGGKKSNLNSGTYRISGVVIDPGLTGYIHDGSWDNKIYSDNNYSNPVFAMCSSKDGMKKLINIEPKTSFFHIGQKEEIENAGVNFSFHDGEKIVESVPILFNSSQIKALNQFEVVKLSYELLNSNKLIRVFISVYGQPAIVMQGEIKFNNKKGKGLKSVSDISTSNLVGSKFIYKTDSCSSPRSVKFEKKLNIKKSSGIKTVTKYSELFSSDSVKSSDKNGSSQLDQNVIHF